MCRAAAPFVDDFDSYTIGNLTGQGSWTDTPSFTVSGTGCNSGNCARSSNNGYANKIGDTLSTGDWYFQFKYVGTINTYIELRFWNYSGGGLGYIYAYPNGDIKLNGYTIGNLAPDTYGTIGVHWTGGNMTANLNGGTLSPAVALGGNGTINMIWQFNNYSNDYYLDNFTDVAPPTDHDTISITYPATTPAYFDHMTVSYHIQHSHAGFGRADVMLCGGDVFSCETLCENGYNAQYDSNCFRIINTTGCPDNDTFDKTLNLSSMMVGIQNATSSLVMAKAYLFAADPNATPHCAFTGSIYDLEDSPEWLATSDELGVMYNRNGIETAGQQEDCSQYSGIDNVVCNIKNFFIGAFLPSAGAINQFQNTLSDFNQKFPMAYISAVVTNIGDIYTGINENSDITLTIFGNTGTVDKSIFDIVIPNTSLTFGNMIKAFIGMIAIMVFLLWAIGYMHRLPHAA